MKVNVTVKVTKTATIDIGELPIPLFKSVVEVIETNDDVLDNYMLDDLTRTVQWVTDSVEVVKV